MPRLGLILICTCLLFGCARCGLTTFRLARVADQVRLIPPGVRDPLADQRKLRQSTSTRCDPPAAGLSVESKRKKLIVTVRRDALEPMAPGGLVEWSVDLERAGCLPPGAGLELAERIAHALPLEPRAAHRLLHANERKTGYIDLRPGYRVRVVSPIFREGAPPEADIIANTANVAQTSKHGLTLELRSSPDLLGFEIAWYAVTPRKKGPGAHIVAMSAERHIDGEIERLPTPASNAFPFDPSAGYFRQLFLSRLITTPQHDILVLAGRTPAELESRFERLSRSPGLCEQEPGFCIAAARQVAFLPFLSVTANGREVRLAPGAAVRDALREGGVEDPELTLESLTVKKPFGGALAKVEFSSADIFELPLMGGERISWRPPTAIR